MDSHHQATASAISHSMPSNDPDAPMNWPLHRKVYASAVSWVFALTVAFGLTSYTAGISGVMKEFNVSQTVAILGMSLFIAGISFAPVWTPHAAERLGRSILYLTLLPAFALFVLGATVSQSITALLVCRFFAGLFGGPCLVLIEGTFADVWSANTTNTYYAFLGIAAYVGAALGPLVTGFVVEAKGWRWTGYITLIITLLAFLFGLGIPETYQREIPRRRAKRQGLPRPQQPLAESGVTVGQMLRLTVWEPIVMFFTEPIVMLSSLMLAFHFGVVFQWFISVPAALSTAYKFGLGDIGLAFSSAIVGALLGLVTSIMIEQALHYRSVRREGRGGMMPIEYRLIPAMIGGFLTMGGLFWVGWTASPMFYPAIPIAGTALYVWGNVLIVISLVPYLFDAYPAAGTLSALTVAASLRIGFAAAFPLFIIPAFGTLTPPWTLGMFGFISLGLTPIPFALFFFGPGWRARSRFTARKSIHDGYGMPMGTGKDIHMDDVTSARRLMDDGGVMRHSAESA